MTMNNQIRRRITQSQKPDLGANSFSPRTVILSAAKDLASHRLQTLRFAQGDDLVLGGAI
jgi:hypothetical protein